MSPLGGHLIHVLICADEVEARAYSRDAEYGDWLRVAVDSLTARQALRGRLVGRIVATPAATTARGWNATLDFARERRPMSWSKDGRDRYERICDE